MHTITENRRRAVAAALAALLVLIVGFAIGRATSSSTPAARAAAVTPSTVMVTKKVTPPLPITPHHEQPVTSLSARGKTAQHRLAAARQELMRARTCEHIKQRRAFRRCVNTRLR